MRAARPLLLAAFIAAMDVSNADAQASQDWANLQKYRAAFDLAQGKTPQSSATVEGIPAVLNPPTAVTLDTIESTVIADGFYTAAELCTADYADACKKAGIS